jgi:hypothetical protein
MGIPNMGNPNMGNQGLNPTMNAFSDSVQGLGDVVQNSEKSLFRIVCGVCVVCVLWCVVCVCVCVCVTW